MARKVGAARRKANRPPGPCDVQACPTNDLLDADGKTAWRSVGFDVTGVRAALARLGIE